MAEDTFSGQELDLYVFQNFLIGRFGSVSIGVHFLSRNNYLGVSQLKVFCLFVFSINSMSIYICPILILVSSNYIQNLGSLC